MVKKSVKKLVSGLKQPEFPMNTFEVFMNSRLLELSVVKRDHEKRWGINRLIELVDSEFRDVADSTPDCILGRTYSFEGSCHVLWIYHVFECLCIFLDAKTY